jgi:hypothetical protein
VAYTVYTAVSKGKRDDRPIISLRLNSKIRLNMAATQVLTKNGIERVRVLWDAQKRKIALAAAADDDPHGYKLYLGSKGNQGSIGIRSFGVFIGLKPGPTVKVYASFSHKMLEARIPDAAFENLTARNSKRDLPDGSR